MPKKKTKNLYWTKETEQAVIDYNNTDDPLLKNQIFNTHLYKPLSKMTEIMIRKFGYFKLYNMKLNYDISDCIEDTIGFVVTKIHYFDPSKGFKAFSYLSLVIKHYLMQQNMKDTKFNFRNVQYNSWMDFKYELPKQLGFKTYENDSSHDKGDPSHVDLYKEILKEISNHFKTHKPVLKKIEYLKIFDSLLDLLENPHGWGMSGKQNKKAIFQRIREEHDVTTNDINYVLNQLKQKYPKIKNKVLKRKTKKYDR